jgi:hypothetical protein
MGKKHLTQDWNTGVERMGEYEDKAVIDADFFIKLTETIADQGNLFLQLMKDLKCRPVFHAYVVNVELKRNPYIQEMIREEKVDVFDYDDFLASEERADYEEYFRMSYETMNRFEFPEDEDVYQYHDENESLGEIRSLYLAKQLQCRYFLSDDSQARRFAKEIFTNKHLVTTMSIYEALKQCAATESSITLKALNPTITILFREQRDRLRELQELFGGLHVIV